MTAAEAKRIIHPETTVEALAEIKDKNATADIRTKNADGDTEKHRTPMTFAAMENGGKNEKLE